MYGLRCILPTCLYTKFTLPITTIKSSCRSMYPKTDTHPYHLCSLCFVCSAIFVRPYMEYRAGPRNRIAASLSVCLDLCVNSKTCDWSMWFMKVILHPTDWSLSKPLLIAGSTTQVYRDWCTVYRFQAKYVCPSLDENDAACSVLPGSKDDRKSSEQVKQL